MSSAILYVAIVAIWAGVLVPRWLRHDSSRDRARGTSPQQETTVPGAGLTSDGTLGADSTLTFTGDAELASDSGPPSGWRSDTGIAQDRASQEDLELDRERTVRTVREGRPSVRPQGRTEAEYRRHSGRAHPRVLMARRRMLTMLVLLTAVAGALFGLRLAAWWVVIPPTVMLLGYLMLLREAARADVELARRDSFRESARESARARREAASVVSQPVSATPAGPDAGTNAHEVHWGSPDAEIIDISGRVSDQLYDQYADAKLRAVGD